jgi:hypothetical protein
MQRYEDALKDFDCAIELNLNLIGDRTSGATYGLMKRYEDLSRL